VAEQQREYQHKLKLIEQAKAEYSKKHLPASKKTEGGDSTSTSLTSLLDITLQPGTAQ
jgi:hypothetical protein